MENGKCAIARKLTNEIGLGSTEFHVFRVSEQILSGYLFALLNRNYIRIEAEKQMTGSSGHRRVPIEFYENIKIPLPPKEIQEKIVSECEAIDQATEQAQQTIDEAKKAIEDGFIEANSKADKTLKLSNSDIFEVSIGKRVIASEIEQTENGIAVFSANVFEPFGYINKDVLENFDRPSVIWGIDGDWMVNYIKENKPFYPTDHCGVLRVKENEINPRYLTWLLDKAGQEIHFSRNHRASIDRIKGLTVNVPTIQVQDEIVTIIEKLEQEIKQAQTTIETAPRQKQQILDNYLN